MNRAAFGTVLREFIHDKTQTLYRLIGGLKTNIKYSQKVLDSNYFLCWNSVTAGYFGFQKHFPAAWCLDTIRNKTPGVVFLTVLFKSAVFLHLLLFQKINHFILKLDESKQTKQKVFMY